ncbi:MAG: DUF3782 domain-containing protein [Cytophagales bacterium]|nr:DUF3782 domain-containing protein [Cytophagales bacterium]
MISKSEIREYLVNELPDIIEKEPKVIKSIYHIHRNNFSDKAQTDDRFDRMFAELDKNREENNRQWQETNKRLDETIRRSDELWKETNKRLDETSRRSDEQWKETNKRLDESMRQSDERFQAMLQEIKDIRSRQESSIGALGARWGIAAESSFRNGLKAIMEDRFDVKVLNVTEYDYEGFVFRQPDQVELDVIIRNGEIIIIEIKSSVSRSQMYTFHRKVQFYEKQHNCKATAMIVISPMVDKYAQKVADKIGIEVYSYSEDVRL